MGGHEPVSRRQETDLSGGSLLLFHFIKINVASMNIGFNVSVQFIPRAPVCVNFIYAKEYVTNNDISKLKGSQQDINIKKVMCFV